MMANLAICVLGLLQITCDGAPVTGLEIHQGPGTADLSRRRELPTPTCGRRSPGCYGPTSRRPWPSTTCVRRSPTCARPWATAPPLARSS